MFYGWGMDLIIGASTSGFGPRMSGWQSKRQSKWKSFWGSRSWCLGEKMGQSSFPHCTALDPYSSGLEGHGLGGLKLKTQRNTHAATQFPIHTCPVSVMLRNDSCTGWLIDTWVTKYRRSFQAFRNWYYQIIPSIFPRGQVRNSDNLPLQIYGKSQQAHHDLTINGNRGAWSFAHFLVKLLLNQHFWLFKSLVSRKLAGEGHPLLGPFFRSVALPSCSGRLLHCASELRCPFLLGCKEPREDTKSHVWNITIFVFFPAKIRVSFDNTRNLMIWCFDMVHLFRRFEEFRCQDSWRFQVEKGPLFSPCSRAPPIAPICWQSLREQMTSRWTETPAGRIGFYLFKQQNIGLAAVQTFGLGCWTRCRNWKNCWDTNNWMNVVYFLCHAWYGRGAWWWSPWYIWEKVTHMLLTQWWPHPQIWLFQCPDQPQENPLYFYLHLGPGLLVWASYNDASCKQLPPDVLMGTRLTILAPKSPIHGFLPWYIRPPDFQVVLLNPCNRLDSHRSHKPTDVGAKPAQQFKQLLPAQARLRWELVFLRLGAQVAEDQGLQLPRNFFAEGGWVWHWGGGLGIVSFHGILSNTFMVSFNCISFKEANRI